MKFYKVYQHQDGRTEAVKQGWSWPGFLFGMIWALCKKLWAVAGIIFAICLVIGVVSFMLEPNPYDYASTYQYYDAMRSVQIWDIVTNIISLGIAVFLGVKGNSLRETNLISRGYTFIGSVTAVNPDMAIAEAIKQAQQSNQNPNPQNFSFSNKKDDSNNNGGNNIVV